MNLIVAFNGLNIITMVHKPLASTPPLVITERKMKYGTRKLVVYFPRWPDSYCYIRVVDHSD